eukprot:5636389-Amphidinium_carterae.1
MARCSDPPLSRKGGHSGERNSIDPGDVCLLVAVGGASVLGRGAYILYAQPVSPAMITGWSVSRSLKPCRFWSQGGVC